MSRTHTTLSVEVLQFVEGVGTPCPLSEVYTAFQKMYPRKKVYDVVFRLEAQGLLLYANPAKTMLEMSSDGRALLSTRRPVKDGVWKLVIFDIPETQRKIRTVLRNQLKAIGFRKWQGSIWISPYALDASVEQELSELAKHYFVRLIKTTDINVTTDLEELFRE